MPQYVALVGNQPIISKAELAGVLPDFSPVHTFQNEYMVFQTNADLDQAMLNRLGGTILIARGISEGNSFDLDDLPSMLATELSSVKGKATFALRLIGIGRSPGRQLLRACKDGLRKRGVTSRYVGNESNPPKPVQLHDEGLLDPKRGCELTILRDDQRLWIGRTVAAQDIKAYTLRDIGKPVRDTTVGLLPPKLAQILLNFGAFLTPQKRHGTSDMRHEKKGISSLKSQVSSPPLTVLDPFCGTGVIPLEALLRHFTVLASDVSQKAVNGCTKNIEWARKTFKIPKKDVDATVWKQDATKPFYNRSGRYVPSAPGEPDVIVTEGTLGPTFENRPMNKDVSKILKQIEELELAFLKNVKETLPGVPVVMTWPVWYLKKEPLFLEKIIDRVTDIGFRFILPPHTDPMTEGRPTLLYRRKNQFVGREIVLLNQSAQ